MTYTHTIVGHFPDHKLAKIQKEHLVDLEELKPLDGKVLRTSLSNVEEANLKAALVKDQTEQEVQATCLTFFAMGYGGA